MKRSAERGEYDWWQSRSETQTPCCTNFRTPAAKEKLRSLWAYHVFSAMHRQVPRTAGAG